MTTLKRVVVLVPGSMDMDPRLRKYWTTYVWRVRDALKDFDVHLTVVEPSQHSTDVVQDGSRSIE